MEPLREIITKEQAENIEIHAKFLIRGNLSGRFDMSIYTGYGAYAEENTLCGTVACAAGYAPESLGWEKCAPYWRASRREFYFNKLVENLFGIHTDGDISEWRYLFNSDWCHTDNTAYGAGQRMLWVLNHGLPSSWHEELYGNKPQSWEANPYKIESNAPN